jgi:uncharacterized membrane protein YqjE
MADESGRPRRGLRGMLHRIADSLMELLETRIEILLLEFSDAGGTLARVLLFVIAILACLQLAIVTGILFLLLVVSDQHRLTVLGIASLVLFLTAAGGALAIRGWLKKRPPMFGTTIGELRKDREMIRRRT